MQSELTRWENRARYAEWCQEQLLLKVRDLEAKLESERRRARDAAAFAERCFEDPRRLADPPEWWETMQQATVRQLARLRAEGRV